MAAAALAAEYRSIKRRLFGDAEAQAGNKQKIQPDIDGGGENHGAQGRFPVAQGAERRGEEIVGHGHRQSPENGAHVAFRIFENGGGRVQDAQGRHGQQLSEKDQDDGDSGREKQGVDRHMAQLPGMVRAEFLGHPDGKSLGEALDHAEHHPDQPVCGPDGRDRADAQHLADNHGVRDGIKLLEQAADHQRKGKRKDEPAGIAGGHIFNVCHKRRPPLS